MMVFIGLSGPCYGGNNDSFTPWNFNNPAREEKITASPSFPAYLLIQGVEIFSKYISPVDGDRCQMHPTCAAYSLQVIKKHGFFIGLMMTAGRIIHENNETDYAPLIKVRNKYRFYDPVSNNDFWWYSINNLDK